MQIIISARNLSVSDRFREYVEDRTHKIEHIDSKVESLTIKVTRHDHQRAAGQEDQVELTVREPGQVVRAEAQAGDKFAAFDVALDKLSERLRRRGDKAKFHRGQHRALSITELSAHDFKELSIQPVDSDVLLNRNGVDRVAPDEAASSDGLQADSVDLGDSPVVIRRKEFDGAEMTVDDALYHMELVGHDFYLFFDAETKKPSVVYRRKGWNYGLIALS